MNSGGSAPQFNAQQTNQDSTKSNVNTAVSQTKLNQVNQVTPQGSLKYDQTGGSYDFDGNFIPSYTATQTYSPEQQKIYDKTTGLQSGALDVAQGLLPGLTRTINNPLSAQSSDALREKAYNDLMGRTRGEFDRTSGIQNTNLANQGIAPGSEAYRRATESRDRALTDASQQSSINAGNIASQNLQQEQTIRNQPLADYQAILGLGGTNTNPGYINTPQTQIAPTDVSGNAQAQYGGQLNAFNRQQGASNALMGGLFGLGGSVLGGALGGPMGAGLGGSLFGSLGRGIGSGTQF